MKIDDKWGFIEKWLPDYYHNEDVAYSNDLQCYIDGETENGRYYELQDMFPDVEDAELEMEAVDGRLFAEAWDNYKADQEAEMERKRKEAEKSKGVFDMLVTLTLGTKISVRAFDEEDARRKVSGLFDSCGVEDLDKYEIMDIIIEPNHVQGR